MRDILEDVMPSSRTEVLWLFTCGAIVLILYASLVPDVTRAVKNDANKQCPPGGQKGQPCKDNTNGYITNGKCKFIYFCSATDYDKNPPSKCDGAIGSQNCPVGKPYSASSATQPSATQPTGSISKKGAASTPRIRISGRSISEIEDGVLDAAFSSEEDVSPDVDPEVLSESGNAALYALLDMTAEEAEEEGLLTYAPESFGAETSTLYQSLRDSAIQLSANKPEEKDAILLYPEANTRVFISDGSFESVTLYASGGSDPRSLLTSRAGWSAFSGYLSSNLSSWIGSLLSALVHVLLAIGNIVIADFAASGAHWDAAQADFASAYAHLGRAFSALFIQALQIRLW